MAKYILADKLIAEIDKRLSIFEHGIAYDCWASCKKIVESLQQEQPEVDLEKEIKDWCDKNITGVRPIYTADSLIYSLLPETAHHFYELGLNARKK